MGRGRLGLSLAGALRTAGLDVEVLPGRAATDRPVVLLCLPDDAVATRASAGPWRSGQLVAHCTGGLGADALQGARDAGARTGWFHPLQTFPTGGHGARFRGVAVAVDADAGDDRELLVRLVEALGARPIRVPAASRARYHAAAVMVANGLIALAAGAAALWQEWGVPRDEALSALLPLIEASAANLREVGLPGGLTGPVARGDVETVRRHLEALEHAPSARDAYVATMRLALEVAREQGLETVKGEAVGAVLGAATSGPADGSSAVVTGRGRRRVTGCA